MTPFHLGIDVAKDKLDCALRLPNGKFRTKVVTNDSQGHSDLVDWLAQKEALDVHVCMEATGVYWEDSAQFLSTQGVSVSVVNPAQIKAYAASRLTIISIGLDTPDDESRVKEGGSLKDVAGMNVSTSCLT